MNGMKEYGKFLSKLNQYGKIGKVIKIESIIKTEIKDVKTVPYKPVSTEDISKNTVSFNVKMSPERNQFNETIAEAMKYGYSIISKQTKSSKYSYELRGNILDTVLNNMYTGIITANGYLVEIKRKCSRDITVDMDPPKELFTIAPKLGESEKDTYNRLINFVIEKKFWFFSKKRGVGYSYGYSKDVISELINCDYFGIISAKRRLYEFIRRDSRKITSNMELPGCIKSDD